MDDVVVNIDGEGFTEGNVFDKLEFVDLSPLRDKEELDEEDRDDDVDDDGPKLPIRDWVEIMVVAVVVDGANDTAAVAVVVVLVWAGMFEMLLLVVEKTAAVDVVADEVVLSAFFCWAICCSLSYCSCNCFCCSCSWCFWS